MQKQNLKKIVVVTVAVLSAIGFFLILLFITRAQSASVTSTLTIEPGIIGFDEPNDFSFDPVFVPNNGDPIYIYKVLQPGTPGNIFKLNDQSGGQDIRVAISITDFTSGTNVIPSSNISFVTLAENTAAGVDVDPGGDDPQTSNVTAPNSCPLDLTTSTIKKACANYWHTFSGGDNDTLLFAPEPPENRLGAYSTGFGFRALVDSPPPGDYTATITFTIYRCPPEDGCL